MLRSILYAPIFFLFPLFAFSQDPHSARIPSANQYGTEMTFAFGGQFGHFPGLNGQLKAAGINPLTAGIYDFGFGQAFRIHKVIFGVDENLLASSQLDVHASGFVSDFYFSTNELASQKLIFSPRLGISWQVTNVEITEPSTASSFANALTSPGNQVELGTNNTFLDLGMALKIRTLAVRHYLPVLKAGYRYGLGEPTWGVRKSAVTDGPHDRGSNFYFQLLLGLGS